MSVMYFVSESAEALAAITEVSFSKMPKFEQTTLLTLLQNQTQIPVTLLNVSDMPQYILKSPAHLLSILSVHSKNTRLMSFAGYLLMLS
jgi:hypothetical protein